MEKINGINIPNDKTSLKLVSSATRSVDGLITRNETLTSNTSQIQYTTNGNGADPDDAAAEELYNNHVTPITPSPQKNLSGNER